MGSEYRRKPYKEGTYYAKNRERILAIQKTKGYERTPEELEKHREYMKQYAKDHPEYNDRQNKLRYLRDTADRPKTNKRMRNWINKKKYKILEMLGNRCACCGEETIEFLCVDHVKGGGSKHRQEFKGRREKFWDSILNDPLMHDKYRALCHNCNMSLGFYKYCPHDRQKFDIIGIAC